MESISADTIIAKIERNEIPSIEDIKYINETATQMFRTMPNVIPVQAPVVICGDIHGQFEDLMELFKIGGKIPFTNYLFMGDYVDRGAKSVETVSYLFCLMIKYPKNITLLRGNHESAGISQVFGFRDEVVNRYGDDTVWKIYTETFCNIPIAALINDKILCVHGGLSPSLRTIKDIQSLDRFTEIPHKGPLCDLVWSDPTPQPGFRPSERDAGYQFGPDITKRWNEENGLELTARGHQLVISGLEYNHNNQIVTVFSAPDYCGRCGNLGGILELDENLKKKDIRFPTATSVETSHEDIPKYYSFTDIDYDW
ncbi:Minor serine/threonine protein phosphatase PP2A-1 catalytic subunit, putative [Trichomonas vaginalis G3]|uniref:Serine/threonine-protein phosphatase n=1 Tax=Trichomonas vaginalis (strain ATCC PRA-98 / G3) TaxID=412133 RepID=A2EU29_TRIV3|nr:phosphoprotein phosphatase protein [Trichomonas vaginalis G3]EAY03846.1 Minor serine/threonine protein phosphatase PP2A-1 catalytic subunit, putative [Trichomonas vaginalis G3]KAI5487496.1 phosphoprotein phosphatase protein [Trichomonas vaginalis G3]|eukprot:XP_001316069.1 Minor serine/threonine protein phosphatase PP2A-1 catalytic subunit [Trichomonas vaginalis G3]